MPPRAKAVNLPRAVKEWLDRALVDGNFSGYRALQEELSARGFDISKSALQRYGQSFERRLDALKLASEQARVMVQAAPDEEGAVNEALTRLVQEKLFGALMELEVDPAKLNLASAAKAVAELGKATVVQKKWAAEVRRALDDAADNVEKEARAQGMDEDQVMFWREKVLGVR
ncbi:MAG: DUF3486 family protein [Alphaproteobacteria bacterium]|jgi:hypothetical protein|nr:DUF3486 family protein [Alphaproteobacteria bacterium]